MASLKRANPIPAVFRLVADTVFPPRCASCRGPVAADGNFCLGCFDKLHMIAAPMCKSCGIPFVVAMDEHAQCPACLEEVPAYDVARSVMVYDAISAPLVTSLKFHDQWASTQRMVQMMAAAGRNILQGADMLVPVPLHWRRLIARKFNQSAVLAYGLSKRTGIPCVPEALIRTQFTKPQMRLDRATRKRNVARAFAVPGAARKIVADKTVVLVDDVITTGATAEACAKMLRQAGAKEVRVLTLARTVKD